MPVAGLARRGELVAWWAEQASREHLSATPSEVSLSTLTVETTRQIGWVVYCKRLSGGPEGVLRYIALLHQPPLDDNRVTVKKDYRIPGPW